MYRVWCVVMVAILCAEAGLFGGAFFCRDPDTGKLYPINTTWRSSSFCGNYHCRLRRKNLTHTQYGPVRQINITNINLGHKNDKKKYLYNNNKINIQKEDIDVTRINNMVKHDVNNITYEDPILDSRPKLADGDRYLSEQEIEIISAILHVVKKSDLDAMIDIFNLAQEIYKEVDNTNPEILINEPVSDVRQDNKLQDNKLQDKPVNIEKRKEKVSYWYEPISNAKQREFMTNTAAGIDVVTSSSTHIYATTPKPKASVMTLLPLTLTTAKTTGKPDKSYFEGTLIKDLGDLPYYYSLSHFQKPIPVDSVDISPLAKIIVPRGEMEKYKKDIKPSVYLPYPFSQIPHYYYWTYLQTINNNKRNTNRANTKNEYAENLVDTKRRKNYVKHDDLDKNNQLQEENIEKVVLVNPDIENYLLDSSLRQSVLKSVDEEKEDYDLYNLEKKMEKGSKPDWQTDPISKQILEEARAHIEKLKFLKPLYTRKKIKLERVGKAMKLDEHIKRSKRKASVSEPQLYEVYIERTTCQTDDSVPGFFRYGNISEPYPECCPQRIL